MLRWRLLLGTVIIAALVGVCWLDHYLEVGLGMPPGIVLFPVAALFVLVAGDEMLQLAAAGGLRPVPWAVQLGNLALLASSWVYLCLPPIAAEVAGYPFAAAAAPLVTLAAALMLVLGCEIYRYQRPGGALANTAAALLAIVYIGVMFTFIAQLRLLWGIAALGSLVLVVKAGDIGAYTVGRLIGRTKMAPVLSPGKTLEGAAGALAFSLGASWLTFTWLVPATGAPGGGQPWGWIVFGLLVGAVGIGGDLAESLLKRDVGRKDSSQWLPGFGGVLDMVDSVLLAAPVAWFFWAVGLVG